MAELPRLQLFEFNDAPWAPPALRELIVDSLSLALERGRMLDGLIDPVAEFMRDSGSEHILDLCAGAGAPDQRHGEEGQGQHVAVHDPPPGCGASRLSPAPRRRASNPATR